MWSEPLIDDCQNRSDARKHARHRNCWFLMKTCIFFWSWFRPQLIVFILPSRRCHDDPSWINNVVICGRSTDGASCSSQRDQWIWSETLNKHQNIEKQSIMGSFLNKYLYSFDLSALLGPSPNFWTNITNTLFVEIEPKYCIVFFGLWPAQWPSGRVFALILGGCGFNPQSCLTKD